ncbi:hypothetical protein ACFL2R_02765 [Patescibacteria group bacterium]
MERNSKFAVLLGTIINKNDALMAADNTLDEKSLSLVSVEVAIGVGYTSFVLLKIDDSIKYFEGVCGLIFLTVSAIFLIVIIWPKKYVSISPDISKHQDYLNKSEKELCLQLISDSQYSFTKNRCNVEDKSKFFRDALILFFLSIFLLILSVLNKIYV